MDQRGFKAKWNAISKAPEHGDEGLCQGRGHREEVSRVGESCKVGGVPITGASGTVGKLLGPYAVVPLCKVGITTGFGAVKRGDPGRVLRVAMAPMGLSLVHVSWQHHHSCLFCCLLTSRSFQEPRGCGGHV